MNDRIKQLSDNYLKNEQECAVLEEDILKIKLDMDTKGPHLHRKITTLNSIKQDLMKLRSKYISLLDTEKRVHAEISKEKSEKNCLYLSLVSVEEEANKSRNALNQLENEFLLQRDTMVMNYVGKRAELCTQASLY